MLVAQSHRGPLLKENDRHMPIRGTEGRVLQEKQWDPINVPKTADKRAANTGFSVDMLSPVFWKHIFPVAPLKVP